MSEELGGFPPPIVPRARIFDKETLLPISMAASLIGGALWISTSMSALGERISLFEQSVNYRLSSLEARTGGGWTRDDMRKWVREFRAATPNPERERIPTVD